MSGNEKRVPKRRFREFENAEGWEQRKFDEEVEFYSGLTYSPNDVSDNGTFVLRSSNVKNGEIVEADNVYVNSEIVNSSNVKEGDIIVVVRNGSRSLIGKHAQIKRSMDKTVIGAFMTGIRSNQSSFINTLMDTQQFSVEVEKNLGATINQITNGMFHEMRFMFPNIEEQNQIGNFFNNLKNLITLHQHKLEKMKALKKAYLTDMFPAEGECKPKLRFAGFTDDWEQCEFSDIFNLSQGLQIEISKRFVNYSKKMYFYITNEFLKSNSNERYYIYNPPESVLCDESDILMTRTGNTGIVVTDVKGCFHNNFFKIKYDHKNYDKYFICQYLSTPNMQKKILNSAGSSTIPDLSHKSFYKLLGNFPDIIEQKRISDFLINLDNLITLHQHKLEKLQNIKKAYLNEMFI